MENLNHKNIIKLRNSFAYKDEFYYVMDYAKGGDLAKYLKTKKILSESESKKIFKQIYESVKYIHSRNVVHRDLKPLNILFMDEEYEHLVVSKFNIKSQLIDFGISGVCKGNINEKVKSGTARFLPPEVIINLFI